jgi:coenzyme Q-binding protein COQ10
MGEHHAVKRVQHSAKHMFDLVAHVEHYPRFVPLCEALKVKKREERDGKTVILADMTVAYSMFRDTFTSRVTLDPAALTIRVDYITGPFSSLVNTWSFAPVTETSCDVDFFIAWEMKSRTLSLVVGTVFERAFLKFADAFEARADFVYNRRHLAESPAN